MEQLITETIRSYLRKRVTFREQTFQIICEYVPFTEFCTVEGAEAPSHTAYLKVGFLREHDQAQFTTVISLPVVNDHGMLQKGSNIYDRIFMVMPPVRFTNRRDGQTEYLEQLIGTASTAARIDDFMPSILKTAPETMTKLHQELLTSDIPAFSDTRQWIVLPIGYALIELCNHKIMQDIAASFRNGFKGISATSRALSTFVMAATRYQCTEEDTFKGQYDFETEESDIVLSPIGRADKACVLVLHKLIEQAHFGPLSPIDFVTSSSSLPLKIARPKHGVSVENCKFVGTPLAPYASHRLSTVGILSDDPHRVFVSRGIARALPIDEPMLPYVMTNVITPVDSLSLPGIRMTHELNIEDGIIVSEEFARRMGAYKVFVDTVSFPYTAEVSVAELLPYTDPVFASIDTLTKNDPRHIAHMAHSFKDLPCVLSRGQQIATVRYEIPASAKSQFNGTVTETVTENGDTLCMVETVLSANIPLPGVILSIQDTTSAEDTVLTRSLRVVTLVYLPLIVGDKITDGHGNKATIAAILPTTDMPIWSASGYDIQTHYIATPFVGKRLAVGAEIEDKLALVSYTDDADDTQRAPLCIDALKVWSLQEVNTELEQVGISYTGTVTFEGQTFEGIPVSMRQMYRLDNNAIEALVVRSGVKYDDEFGRWSNNVKLGLDLVTLSVRGAVNIAREALIESKAAQELKIRVLPKFAAILGTVPDTAQTIEISVRLPKALLGSVFTYRQMCAYDLTNTVLDPRLMHAYGIVTYGDDTVVLPPASSLCCMKSRGALMSIHSLASQMNNIVADIVSLSKGFDTNAQLRRRIQTYRRGIASALAGKDGLLRRSLFPVFPYSIYAVASPYLSPTGDPYEIALPRRAFHKLMKDPTFAQVYSTCTMALVKRDPVHDTNSQCALRFTVWNHETIGMPAWLMHKAYGDYDGDKLTVMFPTDALSLMDMEKLLPVFEEKDFHFKQLTNATETTVFTALYESRGITSTFDALHPLDQVKNPDLCARLVKGLDMNEIAREAVKAARDFHVIKRGTSLTGALGLRFIFSRNTDDTAMVEKGLQLYHAIAQNTLDAKSGCDLPALDLVTAVNKGYRSQIGIALKALGFTDIRLADELSAFAVLKTQQPDTFVHQFPVLMAMQRQAPVSVIEQLAARTMARDTLGHGTWERLFTSLVYDEAAFCA